MVRLAFVLSGSVDTFDRAAFTKSLAALLGVEPSAISLEVSAASVRVRATVNAESAEEAADLAATVDALDTETASARLGVTVESLEDAVACDSSRGGSKGCGGGEVIPTADDSSGTNEEASKGQRSKGLQLATYVLCGLLGLIGLTLLVLLVVSCFTGRAKPQPTRAGTPNVKCSRRLGTIWLPLPKIVGLCLVGLPRDGPLLGLDPPADSRRPYT